MSIGEYCNRELVIVSRTESVKEAVNLMRSHHVGDVIVVDRQGDLILPIGILTDRDIVLEILAEDIDLNTINIGDVMSYELVTIPEKTTFMDTIKYMRIKGVRRMPVVDGQGSLVGLITADDILELVAEQLHDIVGLFHQEQKREIKQRSVCS